MAVFQLPAPERKPWPTLGPEVCAWQEASLAFGPGDLRGERYVLDVEDRAYLYAAYEVNPPDHGGRCRFARGRCTVGGGTCGRRRFDTVVLMLRKGLKKSERGGGLIAVELAADGPVRCDGFRREGGMWIPQGRPVTDPYIPVVAYSEKQASDTSFQACHTMISEGPAADAFDIGLDRIMRAKGDGKAEALSTAPDSRDGARTTFQVKEETHRWVLPRQLEASATMSANLAKRPIAEPWEVHLTTAYVPGQGSLAETMHDAALEASAQPDGGRRSRMYFYYRWADEDIAIADPAGIIDPVGLDEAVEVSTGPTALDWSDLERIAGQFTAAGADRNYLERVWLNRTRKTTDQAFDVKRWKAITDIGYSPEPGAVIVLAWHGNRTEAAALIACEVATGYLWAVDIWQKPIDAGDGWDVPEGEWEVLDADGEPLSPPVGSVSAAVQDVFALYSVWRFYVNPDRWESSAALWARVYGEDRVLSWRANAFTELSRATRALLEAIRTGEVTHPDDPMLALHLGSARRLYLGMRDEDGERVWIPAKERSDSPRPVSGAIGSVIVWKARLDALKKGVLEPTVLTAY